MKLSYDKSIEKQVSAINGKFKLLKSSSKLPNLSKQNTMISYNYSASADENRIIEFENLNSEKLSNELNKYKQELQKYKEIRDEAKINFEFSKVKTKQREKELRIKILLTNQKLNSKDFEILKSQINNISNKIVNNITLMDQDAKKEIKSSKIDMNSRLSLKLLDVENKHNSLINGKYLLKEHKLNEFMKQMQEMEKVKENCGKLFKKKEEFEKLNILLKEKINNKEGENLDLKKQVFELIRVVNDNNDKAFEERLATNKKSNLNNFEKLKKIIDNRIFISNNINENFEKKNEHKDTNHVNKSYNLSILNKTNNANYYVISNRNKKSATGNIFKNINLIYNLNQFQGNFANLKIKVNGKILQNKRKNKDKVKFLDENENIEINFTSKRQSQVTNLPVLMEESLLEKQSQINKNDDKSSEQKSSECFFSNDKISNEVSKENKNLNEINYDLDLKNLAINLNSLNNCNKKTSKRNLNQINSKESQTINNKTSNFYSEKNEISFFNIKYLNKAVKFY
jgi:hypothetical protein